MNEKIKFKETAYELATNGASFGDEKARVIFILPEGKTYEEVETDIAGADRIEVLDSTGDILEARKGYIYLDDLVKKKDYVVGTEQVESGTDEATGESTWVNQDVTATVMIATLKKADVRQEMETKTAELTAKVEYVAMMANVDLEV